MLLSRLYGGLCDERHAILLVGKIEAMKVNGGRFGQVVRQYDPDAIALAHANLRRRHDTIVRPRLDPAPRLYLPLHHLRRKIVDLYTVLHARGAKLGSLALGLRRKRP